MTENSIDVNIVPVKNGMKRVVVSYYHYSRKEKDRMSFPNGLRLGNKVGKQRMKKCLNTLRPGGQKYFIVRFVPCVDSMARKMYVNTKSYDIKNDNQRVLFH